MKGTHLGEFEELVLLMVGVLHKEAYGIAIKDELEKKTGRRPSIGALHSALTRLGEKGFLDSRLEEATEDRRGRRKRFYLLTPTGTQAIKQVYEIRKEMINLIPNLAGS